MNFLRRNTFAQKMMVAILLASAVSVLTLMVAFLILDTISSRALLNARLSTLADVVGTNSTAALNFNDSPAAVEVLEALRAEPPIVTACLYDASGVLFAKYQRQSTVQPCSAARIEIAATGRDFPSVQRPVYRHGEFVGTVFLISDVQQLKERWRRMLLLGALLLFAALLIGGISGSLLQVRISQPILELAGAMRKVTAEQEYGVRVAIAGSDEIAQLGDGFNTMLRQLERREKEKLDFEAKLSFQATNDTLTGLPNRRLFTDRLAQGLASAQREKHLMALLYIDLDGFKLVNDSLGHSIGDALLVQVASRWQARVRKADTLARLGGDEFTVILTNVRNKEAALEIAMTLLENLAIPFQIEGHQLAISASIGISMYPENALDGPDLMQQADSAMYAAKRNGRNQAMYFSPELGTLVRERLTLENQLRNALVRKEIHIAYQPEFDAITGRLVRFEALARWTHPTLGSISPAKFIPVAEESGLIVPLGEYILEAACREATKWNELTSYPIQVAVNVSTIQFIRSTFVDEVEAILKRTGLKRGLLQLELTESVMINGMQHSVHAMKRLKALGVGFAIDDFGTGYSCLSYLPALPFDSLKIDRSFVKECHLSPDGKALVQSLINLAHNIGLRVIVEGVENAEQLDVIRTLGGNEIQGFLLGRPTPDPVREVISLTHKASGPNPELETVEDALTGGNA